MGATTQTEQPQEPRRLYHTPAMVEVLASLEQLLAQMRESAHSGYMDLFQVRAIYRYLDNFNLALLEGLDSNDARIN